MNIYPYGSMSMGCEGTAIAEIGEIIHAAAPEDCNIIFGVVFDENMGDDLRITVIATGIEPVLAPSIDLPGNATVTQFSNKDSLQTSARRLAVSRPAENREEARAADTRSMSFEPRPKRRGDFELPTADRLPQHRPGHEQFVFDEDNLEIPTFLRTQAD